MRSVAPPTAPLAGATSATTNAKDPPATTTSASRRNRFHIGAPGHAKHVHAVGAAFEHQIVGRSHGDHERRVIDRASQFQPDSGFINEGLLDKHIRRSRRVYAERHHILAEALSGPLACHLTARSPNAGLHVAAVLQEGLSEEEVLQAAARHGLVTSGLHDCFHTSPAQPGLLIGFGAVSTTGLPVALRTLGRILAAQTSG